MKTLIIVIATLFSFQIFAKPPTPICQEEFFKKMHNIGWYFDLDAVAKQQNLSYGVYGLRCKNNKIEIEGEECYGNSSDDDTCILFGNTIKKENGKYFSSVSGVEDATDWVELFDVQKTPTSWTYSLKVHDTSAQTAQEIEDSTIYFVAVLSLQGKKFTKLNRVKMGKGRWSERGPFTYSIHGQSGDTHKH